ncbi:MAG: hypothetical protein IRZ10_01765 [Thermoflavifilum sp.]|nr:hypothetical protein [Thermoflavifilum sp.]MCL6513117.1 hypothetical protein [Alicyclobacillus sp.]
MRLAVIKNLLLACLVALSMVLSWTLWQGNWLRAADVEVAPRAVTTASPQPQLATAIEPQVVVYTAKPALASVLPVGGEVWTRWYNWLHAGLIGPMRPVTGPASSNPVRVAFTYPVALNVLPDASRLSAFGQLPFALAGDALWMVAPSTGGPMYLEVRTQAGWYGAPMAVSAAQAMSEAAEDVSKSGWLPLVAGSASLVPAQGLWMPVTTWSIANTPLAPLVHAFFVNPEVVSRIDPMPGTVMWTDGSRVVRYDAQAGLVHFDDPAVTPTTRSGGGTTSDLEAAAAFLRNHGGTPQGVLLTPPSGDGASTTDLVFRSYVDGYPLLDAMGEYRVAISGDEVIRCQVSVRRLDQRNSSVSVQVMGAQALRDAIHSTWPKADLGRLSVTLGYHAVAVEGGVRLIPAYQVVQDGATLGMLDAVTGDLIQGWSGS